MENHRFTQKEFNDLFFSSLSMAYLGANIGFIFIGLVVCYFILKIHPTILTQEKITLEPEGEGCDDALLDVTVNTSINNPEEEEDQFQRTNLYEDKEYIED